MKINNYKELIEVINTPISSWKKKITILIIFILAFGIYCYFALPIFAIKYISTLRFLIFIITVILCILLNKRTKVLYGAIFLICITIILSFASAPIFNASRYHDLLGDVKTYNYDETMPDIDKELVPVVDEELAKQLGDKVLGEDIGLGSQYDIGEYNLITTDTDIVWVAPLEPRNIFKWFQNRDGSPAYIYVSATDLNDVRLVKDYNGEDVKLKYSNDSYFFNQIDRHVYFEGKVFDQKTDFSFEIDNNGKPYWVISAYEPKVLYGGNDEIAVIIVDATTGETTKYSDTSKIPDWVERVQPEEFISEQINDYGLYGDGYFNSIFAQENVITQTEGHSYVYIDSKPYYYSGLTSVKNDNSTVGFMLVNLRTKESSFYKITGATETAAQSSAEGQVQQYGYSASFPILLNVYDVPTYFMTLKDKDGLLKQYAYVSVVNYNIVGTGNTQANAKEDYYKQLTDNDQVQEDVSETTDLKNQEIERINYIDGTFYIKFKDNKELYSVSSEVSEQLVLSQVGDKVNVTIEVNKSDYIKITKFENQTLGGKDE